MTSDPSFGIMPFHDWAFPARYVRALDGDTVEVLCDLGFTVRMDVQIRLLYINCPEIVGAEKAAGLAAKAFTEAWMAQPNPDPYAWPFLIQTRKSADADKYGGRWDGVIWRVVDGACLNRDLLDSGNAVPFLVSMP